MTTRIGNSRQNDRFLRPRRAGGFGPPEAVLPSGGAALPSGGAALPSGAAASPSSAWPLDSAVDSAFDSALAWPGASAPLAALDDRACSGSGDAALSPWPASGSAPGVTPRPAPLICAPSVRAPLGWAATSAGRPSRAPDPDGTRKPAPLVGVHRH